MSDSNMGTGCSRKRLQYVRMKLAVICKFKSVYVVNNNLS